MTNPLVAFLTNEHAHCTVHTTSNDVESACSFVKNAKSGSVILQDIYVCNLVKSVNVYAVVLFEFGRIWLGQNIFCRRKFCRLL